MNNKTAKLSVCVVGAALILSGCASINISVSSLSSGDRLAGRILILPGDVNIDRTDLLFQEFSGDIELALEQNGFSIVHEADEADQIAFIVYGISDPKNQTIAMPQFGKTGVRSSTTTGNVDILGNSGFYHGTTIYNYDYGITGYTSINRTVYTRVLLIISYDWIAYKKDKKLIQLWQTQLISTGPSSDLREVFPYLALAAEEYVGKSTKKAIRVNINALNQGIEKYQEN
jgi:hypothetical protein